MRVLITGISGFVGKHLAPYLLSKGNEVYGIDRRGVAIEGCEVIQCDLLDKEKLQTVLSDIQPREIYHLGGISSVRYSFEDPKTTRKVNVEGTRNLFDAAIAAHLTPRILVVSSAQVYGTPKELPITELSPLNPQSPYAQSKIEQELLCKKYPQLDSVIIRSFNHTGPGQQPEFVCSSFAKQIAEIEAGVRSEMSVGNLEVSRDFTDVRDVVRAYEAAIKKCRPGEIYNMCSGKAHRLSDILKTFQSLSTKKIKISVEKDRVRKSDADSIYGSNEKLVRATGWSPKIPLDKTLKDMLDDWRVRNS